MSDNLRKGLANEIGGGFPRRCHIQGIITRAALEISHAVNIAQIYLCLNELVDRSLVVGFTLSENIATVFSPLTPRTLMVISYKHDQY